MGDSAAASLLAESSSLAPSTLERATLTGRSTTHTTRYTHQYSTLQLMRQNIGSVAALLSQFYFIFLSRFYVEYFFILTVFFREQNYPYKIV